MCTNKSFLKFVKIKINTQMFRIENTESSMFFILEKLNTINYYELGDVRLTTIYLKIFRNI